jgi:cytochrome P450
VWQGDADRHESSADRASGYRFALLEMKVVLFILLRNFTFDILPSKPEITRKNL